jgi:L-ascorbate metabolism protein UlaG (beta-lactamase superfamily)
LDRNLPVITTEKAARALHRQGFGRAEGLTTWSSSDLSRDGHRLTITALPGRHGKGIAAALLPPVMGSMVEYRDEADVLLLRLYISGDTLFVDDLREIPRRFPSPDVAVLHLGGTTLPGGLVVTMDARQGADTMELIQADTTVPVHYDDYKAFKSPLADFRAEVEQRGLQDRVTYVPPGHTASLPVRR